MLGATAGILGMAGQDLRFFGQKPLAARWSTSISPTSRVAKNTSTGCVAVLPVDTRFDQAAQVERIMDLMNEAKVEDNQFATKWSVTTGHPSNGTSRPWVVCMSSIHLIPVPVVDHFSVGAFADSAHEYLLKQWLLTAKSETKARDLCG